MEATDLLGKYKNNVFNVAVVLLALFIANNIYQGQNRKIALLKETKDAQIKKNELLTNISQLEKRINLYKDLINKKDAAAAINTIGDIARGAGVKIKQVRPEKEKEESFYMVYPFALTVEVDNYHILGNFISKLEIHPDIYTVEQINIGQASEETQTEKLNADLRVSTILLK